MPLARRVVCLPKLTYGPAWLLLHNAGSKACPCPCLHLGCSYPVEGPNGWTMYRTKDTGEPYYHNHRTNQTVWDRPADWPMNGGGM